jgi:hypothetical protein
MPLQSATTSTSAPRHALVSRAAVVAAIAIAGATFTAHQRLWHTAPDATAHAVVRGDLEANKVATMSALSRHSAQRLQITPSRYDDLEANKARNAEARAR